MSEILELQKTINEQIAAQKELTLAELQKAQELKRQTDEIESNNKIRLKHTEALNSLLIEIQKLIDILNIWNQSRFFNNIYDVIEILIPVILQISVHLDLKEDTIKRLETIATNIGKRDINIREIKGDNVALGDKIKIE